MAENTTESTAQLPGARPMRREFVVAWVVNGLACVYCLWVGAFLWRSAGVFGNLVAGLGQEPIPMAFVARQRLWLFPAIFGSLVVVLLAKEVRIRDKRLSSALSFFAVLLAQLLFQGTMTLFYLPVLDLMKKLG